MLTHTQPVLIEYLSDHRVGHRAGGGVKLGYHPGAGDRFILGHGVRIPPPRDPLPSFDTVAAPLELSVPPRRTGEKGQDHRGCDTAMNLEFADPGPRVEFHALDSVKGRIQMLSKQQDTSRALQQYVEHAPAWELREVVQEVLPHASRIASDLFGSYFLQKLVEVCGTQGRRDLLWALRKSGLVTIAMDRRATRVLQKLIDDLEPGDVEAVTLVWNNLQGSLLEVCQDRYAVPVLLRLLPRFSLSATHHLQDVLVEHFLTIATNAHGCLVVQRCLDSSPSLPMTILVLRHVVALSEDPYGNYLVQHVLRTFPSLRLSLGFALAASVVRLSTNKFASNVIERCLRVAPAEVNSTLVLELARSSRLPSLVLDVFGNYVIQTSLVTASGQAYDTMCTRVTNILHLYPAHQPRPKHLTALTIRLAEEEYRRHVDRAGVGVHTS